MRGPADECVCDTRLWHKAYCYLWQSMWLAAVHRTGAVRRPRRQAYWEHLRCMNEKSCVREATVPCTVRRAGALAASARGLCALSTCGRRRWRARSMCQRPTSTPPCPPASSPPSRPKSACRTGGGAPLWRSDMFYDTHTTSHARVARLLFCCLVSTFIEHSPPNVSFVQCDAGAVHCKFSRIYFPSKLRKHHCKLPTKSLK